MNGYRGQATVIRKFGEVENGVNLYCNSEAAQAGELPYTSVDGFLTSRPFSKV